MATAPIDSPPSPTIQTDDHAGPSLTEVILMGSAGVFNALMNSSQGDLVIAQAMYQTVGTLLQVEAVKIQAQMEQQQAAMRSAQPERGRILTMPPRV